MKHEPKSEYPGGGGAGFKILYYTDIHETVWFVSVLIVTVQCTKFQFIAPDNPCLPKYHLCFIHCTVTRLSVCSRFLYVIIAAWFVSVLIVTVQCTKTKFQFIAPDNPCLPKYRLFLSTVPCLALKETSTVNFASVILSMKVRLIFI